MYEWLKDNREFVVMLLALLGLAVLFLYGEHNYQETRLNYKYHLVCGDTDYGVVYRLKEKHGIFKFERPYEEGKHYSVSSIGCTYVKVGE